MSEKQFEQEMEIDFFEPGLSLIITNLEFLEENLENKNSLKKLSSIIDKFNELEDYEKFQSIVDELNNLASELLENIKPIVNANRYELLEQLFTAVNIANNLTNNGDFMQMAVSFENMDINSDQLVEEMKKKLINLFQDSLIPDIQNDILLLPKLSQEFTKILNILTEEEDFREFAEGINVLNNLFKIENKLNDSNFELLAQTFEDIVSIESLINLVDFWENIDEIEE